MICNLCGGEIDTKNEKYVCVQDWDKQKQIREIWCHLICFNKSINKELTDLQKQAKEMLGHAGRVFKSDSFNEMFPERKEFVVK